MKLLSFLEVLNDSRVDETATDSPGFQEWFRGSKVSNRGKPIPVYHGMRAGAMRGNQFEPWTHFGTSEAANNRVEYSLQNQLYMNTNDPEAFDAMGSDHWRSKFPNGAKRGSSIFPVYLSIKNPLRIRDKGKNYEHTPHRILEQLHFTLQDPDKSRIRFVDDKDFARLIELEDKHGGIALRDEIIRLLETRGYDGFVYKNQFENVGSLSYMIFRPDQVWSVFGSKPGSLNEKIEHTSTDMPYLISPSPQEFMNFIKRTEHQELRGVAVEDGNTYWWDAHHLDHSDGADMLRQHGAEINNHEELWLFASLSPKTESDSMWEKSFIQFGPVWMGGYQYRKDVDLSRHDNLPNNLDMLLSRFSASRMNETLNEGVETFNGIKMHKNPSIQQMRNLAANGMWRGLVLGPDVYLFNPADTIHVLAYMAIKHEGVQMTPDDLRPEEYQEFVDGSFVLGRKDLMDGFDPDMAEAWDDKGYEIAPKVVLISQPRPLTNPLLRLLIRNAKPFDRLLDDNGNITEESEDDLIPPTLSVPLDRIVPHPTEGGNYPKIVAKYRRMIRTGKPIDPIFLIDRRGHYYDLDDGHHRYKAHKEEGKTHINAQIIDVNGNTVRTVKP